MPRVRKRWEIWPAAPQDHLAQFSHLPPLLAQVLFNRGMTSRHEVDSFLACAAMPENPYKMAGISQIVWRIRQAIGREERIAVYGDFDADGVTSTALMVQTLTALGANVIPYIPHRVDEGYGLNAGALDKLKAQGVSLVLTVDCGVRAVEEIEHARRIKLDVVVTDHHDPGAELPRAFAIVDPKTERRAPHLPYMGLAGVGLAFRLAQGLLRSNHQTPIRRHVKVELEESQLLDLVALGTVADMAPLSDENRLLVRRGLEQLNKAQRPGVRALLESSGVRPGTVTTTSIGFRLGPRINAAGRLESAMTAYELLTTDNSERAGELAEQLSQLNTTRQRLTHEAVEMAKQQIAEQGLQNDPLIVVSSQEIRAGIVGLVAGKLKEEFYRPVIVLEQGEQESRGSARSISEFHITEALDQCKHLLVRHGGHQHAAGLTVSNQNLPELVRQLKGLAQTRFNGQVPRATVQIEGVAHLDEIDWAVHDKLLQLEPCGPSNPPPVFCVQGVQVKSARAVGDGKHAKLVVSDGKSHWEGIWFDAGGLAERIPPVVDVAFQLDVNEYQGNRSLQLNVQDIHRAESLL